MVSTHTIARPHVSLWEFWVEHLLDVPPTPRNVQMLLTHFGEQQIDDIEQCRSCLAILQDRIVASADTVGGRRLVQHYFLVFSPLMEKVGLYNEKCMLDDLCFKIAEPEAYRRVEQSLSLYESSSRRQVQRTLLRLRALLKEEGINARVSGRFKSLYSVHKKLIQKQYGHPLELHDIFAFRIVVSGSDEQDCYRVLNMLHDRFVPLVDRFKDYVAIPKISGYQSIHTCLVGVLEQADFPVEVQVRTQQMDDFAERGTAAHWVYAQKKRSLFLTTAQRRAQAAEKRCVCVLSKGGDVFRLPEGSTVRDFAYLLHSALGARATHAKVNGAVCDLDTVLQDADRVEIVAPDRMTIVSDHA